MNDNEKAIRDDRKQKGKIGEDVAAYYLEQQGYHLLERNWRCRSGELDIIALAPRRADEYDNAWDRRVKEDWNTDEVEIAAVQASRESSVAHSEITYDSDPSDVQSNRIAAKIMPVIVIAEVRSRTGSTHGTAAESVDWRKRKQLRETAAVYAHHTGQHEALFRYDVITIKLNDHYQAVELEHCMEAFI
ncbi:YraN family protein [Paenibacillus hunanensis]|uniref:YraN family protein n=1 Tax=Paenibacillus hunanensis TaxID=539262 RepID=UPI002A6A4C76|nr:YraN family protein [Paenibacillus hunanensis]WPP39877.1 YraN family protein [Paenibacillus hunanensis]